MKIIMIIFTFLVCVNAIGNDVEEGSPGMIVYYPIALEAALIGAAIDIACNPEETLEEFKSIYKKPLRTDFEYLRVMDEEDAKKNPTF